MRQTTIAGNRMVTAATLALLMACGVMAGDAAAADAAAETSLTGTVVNDAGKPVPGARVAVIGRETGCPPRDVLEAMVKADEAGGFSLKVKGSTYSRVCAYVPGAGLSPPVYLAKATPGMKLQLGAAAGLQLTFVGPDGRPAAGVPIHLVHVMGRNFQVLSLPGEISQDFSGTTDERGVCKIAGLPRNSVVRFDVDDVEYAQLSVTQDVNLQGEGALIVAKPIQLERAGSIGGTLIDPETSKPMKGVDVNVQSFNEDSKKGFGWGCAVTDAKGEFVVERLPALRYVVSLGSIYSEKNEWTAAAAIAKAEEGERVQVKMVMTRGGWVKGQVRHKGTGEGIPGVRVGLQGPGRPDKAAAVYSRLTDEEGRYEFRVPPGEQRPYVMGGAGGLRVASSRTTTVTVKDGETATMDFEMEPPNAGFPPNRR